MFERSPGYFKQFQKQFKFFVTDENLNLTSLNNFAVCSHYNSDFCQLSTTTTNQHHFHVLIDSTHDALDTTKRYKLYSVPCLFTTFQHLFSLAPDLKTKGDVFTKLKLAVDFNIKNGEKNDSSLIRKRLPKITTTNTTTTTTAGAAPSTQFQSKTGKSKSNDGISNLLTVPPTAQKSMHNMILPSKQIQTDNFSSETLRRFEKILTGPHSGAFCQIMDIFVSGYGNMTIDTDLLFVRLIYEEKIKF